MHSPPPPHHNLYKDLHELITHCENSLFSHLLGLKFKLKQRKVPNSFLSTRFNDPYKRQGDLYSRIVGDSWVIQKLSTKVMVFTLNVGESQKSSLRWKLIARPKKRVIQWSRATRFSSNASTCTCTVYSCSSNFSCLLMPNGQLPGKQSSE